MHSFTSKAADEYREKFDMPLAYDADADAKSWASLLELLGEVF
jgi:hypothetical protein